MAVAAVLLFSIAKVVKFELAATLVCLLLSVRAMRAISNASADTIPMPSSCLRAVCSLTRLAIWKPEMLSEVSVAAQVTVTPPNKEGCQQI